jgi:hypothetical protein
MAYRASGDARPYALAVLLGAVVLFGFVKAVEDGRLSSRIWFVAGSAGLIAAHYLFALMLLGVGIAYLAAAPLRERYPLRRFSADVAAIGLLTVPLVPQVLALWERRAVLDWVPQINYNLLYVTFGAEATLVAAGLAAGAFWERRPKINGSLALLATTALTPPLALVVLAVRGTNLLVPRYMLSGLAPLCLLAGVGLALAAPKCRYFGWFGWSGLNALAFLFMYQQDGSFTTAGSQDWRGATAVVGQRLEEDRGAPVLYRSGFIEDDQIALGGSVSSAVFAPLRSPGRAMPQWDMVPLTHTWRQREREQYFERAVAGAVDDRGVFYYLSSKAGDGYEIYFERWVSERFGGRFESERLDAGRDMAVIRFAAAEPAAELRSAASSPK